MTNDYERATGHAITCTAGFSDVCDCGSGQTATQATDLRQCIAEALRKAAFECDGKCGLSERDCYDAHPINFSAMAGGTTHVDGSVTAIADVVLGTLFGPIPEGADTATWTAVRAIQLMNEAGKQRDAACAEATAARKFAAEMRGFCSPHGVAAGYADRLLEAMDRAKEGGR